MSESRLPTPDDSQQLDQRTLRVVTAVAELVDPVKRVLALTQSVMRLAQAAIALMLVVLCGVVVAVVYLRDTAVAVRENAKAIATVVKRADSSAVAMAEVKLDVEDIPRIKVRPMDPEDPTGPAAIIIGAKRPSREGPPAKPAALASVEIELPLPVPREAE